MNDGDGKDYAETCAVSSVNVSQRGLLLLLLPLPLLEIFTFFLASND